MKKLSLNKETIADLNNKQMIVIRAGGNTGATNACCNIASVYDKDWCIEKSHAGYCPKESKKDDKKDDCQTE